MTRAVRDRILKDANADIGDHLRTHIHLTNCIHLKNHMHKRSPLLRNRSLARDLVALRRSRSLRDPSASPPLWDSPVTADLLSKNSERVENIKKVLSNELGRKSEARDMSSGNHGSQFDENRKGLSQGMSGNSEGRSKRSTGNGEYNSEDNPETLPQQLSEIRVDKDGVFSSNRAGRATEEGETSARAACSDFGKVRRRKFRRIRKNSSVKGMVHQRRLVKDRGDEFDEHNVSRGPRNGCGMPFNWSRIHHGGRTFLDKAGRSLSCGLSDPRSKRGGDVPQGRLELSTWCARSDPEALPLLLDGSGSQPSSENVPWAHDYSGELGIFSDILLKHCLDDSDLTSEARSSDRNKSGTEHHGRHQSLTEKYMPRTFRDLVGQNLVARALSNAVVRRKVGLLYVFYGPHGTGKTSSARIFARALNCRSPEHPKPCGFCGSCVAHDTGKSRNTIEVGPVNNFDYETIIDLLNSVVIPHQKSQYRVFIFDDSNSLSPDYCSTILKAIDRAPRHVVFVLISSSLDGLPRVIISRCQKFFFPKLKEADIFYALEWVATREGLEVDKDALRLIASRSDGSLRDAEMTLEQLSLLGQKITVPLVQELVGLISDEQLVDLLDSALSADTVNTVKNLREIMESGAEPLALMSQLATVITDVLAGSYDLAKESRRRKFFQRQSLSKEDMEKLRKALKTLSEAEKQLRVSNDKLTWLTASLLQLAPDQQYMLSSSSPDHVGRIANGKQVSGKGGMEIVDIWLEVLDNVQIGCVKELMIQQGKLLSVSYGVAPTIRLLFTSPQTKSKAEKFRSYILQAFERVLGSPLTIEIICESRKDIEDGSRAPLLLPASDNGSTQMGLVHKPGYSDSSKTVSRTLDHPRSTEIIEETYPREQNQCQSLVRGKVSLAHVIQRAEGASLRSGWTRRKAMSIAEKLEQENLRLEPRSRNLLCWKSSRTTRHKLSRLKFHSRKPHTLLKLVSCGKCILSR